MECPRWVFWSLFGGSVLLVLAVMAVAQDRYDLLLKGGHVIDPKNGINAVRDVAITGGKIARVAAEIPASQANKVVDAYGLYVTPGLVDIHVHVYAGTGQRASYAGDLSVFPDGFTFRTGVTTVVDAGSSGWRDFSDFKDRIIDRSRTRVLAFLNIVGRGMRGGAIEQDLSDMEPEPTARRASQYPGLIVGIKTAHYAAPDWTAVERAVEAGKLAMLPVMVDFGLFLPDRPYPKLVLEKLRPGDISTHMYRTQVPLLDAKGNLESYLFEARKRGVLFDVGHGAGSFWFRQAVPAVKRGWLPDSISTDLHVSSMNAGMKDMVTTMSKFLNMGLSMEEVIRRATWNPARQVRREDLGHLTQGSVADIAVLGVLKGAFGFVDAGGARMSGTQRLECDMTLKDGRIVWDRNGRARQDWRKLGNYERLGDPMWDGTLTASPPPSRP